MESKPLGFIAFFPQGSRLKTGTKSSLTSHTEINFLLRFQRRNPASDCAGIAGRPRGGTRQNKTNRTECGEPTRLLSTSSAAAGPGSAPARDPAFPVRAPPTPQGFHLNKQPRAESPSPMRAAADLVGSRALTSSAGRMGGEQTLAPLGLA